MVFLAILQQYLVNQDAFSRKAAKGAMFIKRDKNAS
jgi:hypothetical protein